MGALHNKVAIITGASSGIGHAAARLFASEGASLVLGARRSQALNTLIEQIRADGGEAIALAGDVAEESYAQALANVALDHFGGLDIAFNNAGTNDASGIDSHNLTAQAWAETLATNLSGAFYCAKYQLPLMLARGRGSIIFTSSFVGYTIGLPKTAVYAASKAGLVGLTRALASEYGAQNIRVNSLLPGGTDTPMGRAFASDPETLAFVKGIHALKRLAEPREIAEAALYLASEASSFSTGSTLLADGGASICKT